MAAGSNFEKDLEKLEEIVSALESGELSLEEALKRFEEGIRLAKRCEKALTEAEKRIEILMKDAQGNIVAQPFGEDVAVSGVSSQEVDEQEEVEIEEELENDKEKPQGEMLF